MPVAALHHYTIRCAPEELDALTDFYTRVLRLKVGARPAIPAPGVWLYATDQPIVHLYAYMPEQEPERPAPVTGPLDHISFRSQGLAEMKAHLAAHGVPYTEAPVPDWPIHQVFLQDTKGLKIELTFFLDEEPA